MSRLIIFRVVVLPHPEGPTRAVRVPRGTSRLSSWTAAAVDPGNTLVTPSSLMATSSAASSPLCSTVASRPACGLDGRATLLLEGDDGEGPVGEEHAGERVDHRLHRGPGGAAADVVVDAPAQAV